MSSATLDNCCSPFRVSITWIRLPSPAIPEALQKAALGHPIYQTHRGMVLDQQEICKFTHRHTVDPALITPLS